VHELLSPDVFPGEVGYALTRAERQGRITVGEALRLWSDVMMTAPRLIASLPLTHTDSPVSEAAPDHDLDLAFRHAPGEAIVPGFRQRQTGRLPRSACHAEANRIIVVGRLVRVAVGGAHVRWLIVERAAAQQADLAIYKV